MFAYVPVYIVSMVSINVFPIGFIAEISLNKECYKGAKVKISSFDK